MGRRKLHRRRRELGQQQSPDGCGLSGKGWLLRVCIYTSRAMQLLLLLIECTAAPCTAGEHSMDVSSKLRGVGGKFVSAFAYAR